MKFNQSSYQNTQGSNLSISLQSVKGFQNFKVREKLHLDKKKTNIKTFIQKPTLMINPLWNLILPLIFVDVRVCIAPVLYFSF